MHLRSSLQLMSQACWQPFFEFNAASGGTTDSGVINSTLFAVTASDDDSVTAIWAHQQASSDDATVDELELNLLAVVNTRDGEFTAENFAIWDATFGAIRDPATFSAGLIDGSGLFRQPWAPTRRLGAART